MSKIDEMLKGGPSASLEAAKADPVAVVSPLPRWKERLLKRQPEATGEEDELKAKFYDDYDALASSYSENEEVNAKLMEAITANPELSIFLKEVLSGTPVRAALFKADINLSEPLDGDEDMEAYAHAVKERAKAKAEASKRAKEYQSNCQASEVEIETFFKEKKALEEEQAQFVDFIDNGILAQLYSGKCDKGLLEKLWKAYKYEEDVATAKSAGEIDGRNAQIEVKRASMNANRDGLPSAGSSITPEPTSKSGYIERLMGRG